MTANLRTLRTEVVILGSGLAGTIAALCLRRQGLAVTVIDQGTHPRFALGESTTTPASLWLRVMAERFDVPELLTLTSAEALHQGVSPSSGIKNNFGFLYHRPGASRPERAWQAVIPQSYLAETELGREATYNEMHYFRQDVDAWLWAKALLAGAVGLPATKVRAIHFESTQVNLETDCGRRIEAQFLIDASGHRSPLAAQLGLRDSPPRFKTHSRSLFTHMAGVKPYEATQRTPDSMARWSQGTLHHFFDGGWMWVIPFGNHKGATNPLTSVGLNIDPRRWPELRGSGPEEQFRWFLAQHPSIAVQFEAAVAVRPWVDTGRVQYSASDCVGDRFWITSHAAGAVDALFSMGNINTFQSLATGIGLVLEAFRDQRFERSRFQPLADLTERLLCFQDRIVGGNYAATRSPDLLRTWIALWSLTDTARIRRVLIPLVRHLRGSSSTELDFVVRNPAEILTGIGMRTDIASTATVLSDLDNLFHLTAELGQQMDAGTLSESAAVARLDQAVESKTEYNIDLRLMEDAFARQPWALATLSRHGLRCHSNCFLTPQEAVSLGVQA
jgi:tetracycline 7-halogenase / FADH2 O2-dependent halogenase